MSAPATSSSSASAPPPPPPPPPISNPSAVPDAPGVIPSAPAPNPNNATSSPNTTSPPLLSLFSQSTSSRPHPSNSASASASASASSAASRPTTTSATTSGTAGAQTGAMDLNSTLPPRTTQLHVNEARAALIASMSNMLDSELQSRASLLHSNAAALTKQERDVEKATDALRKENDKLQKLAKDTERKIKELGNVQNWAEVLERDFLVLEETMRLVREGSGSDSCSECSRSSWSGSYSADSRVGSRRGSVTSGAKGVSDGSAGKKQEGLQGTDVDEDVALWSTAKGGVHARREGMDEVASEELAALISEAMSMDLRDALGSDPPSSSGMKSRSAKGKEPAVPDEDDDDDDDDDNHDVLEVGNIPHTRLRELSRRTDTGISQLETTAEEPATIDTNSISDPSSSRAKR